MRLIIIIALPFVLLICSYTGAKANRAAAGEIVYVHLNDSTYRVIFRLYTDCKGDAAPANVMLCAGDTCGNNSFSTIMPMWTGLIRNNTLPNGSETPIACTPKQPTRCADPNSTLPGYREWWYVDTIALPSRCTGWRLSVTVNSRNSSNNLDNGNLYVETFFNNQISLNNSSPDFANQPLLFVCLNQPFTYNIGATDIDGDSLDIAVVPVKVAPVLACPVTPYNLGVKATNPPFNWNNNPFQTNNSFTLDNKTGEMKFTATSSGSNVRTNTLTLRINEYRNGQLIGSVHRDMQVYVFSCGVVSPGGSSGYVAWELKAYRVPGGDVGHGTIWVNAGEPLHLVFNMTSPDTNAVLIMADNHDSVFSNAVFYYVDNRTNDVKGHLFWTPTNSDAGYNTMKILMTDSACRPPGIYLVAQRHYDIFVSLGVEDITEDSPIKIYPNPNNGIFAVQAPSGPGNQSLKLAIFNVYGQLIYSAGNYKGGQIDISNAAPGMYILNLSSNEKPYMRSFIVR